MNSHLKIKVCGMKDPLNRAKLESLPIDFFGFIFYPQSKRFIGNPDSDQFRELIKTTKKKVGVFVNETAEKILEIARKASFTHIQLHGDETPQVCKLISENGFKTIRAFRIDKQSDFNETLKYEGIADFFLFDTKAGFPGGTGKKFEWKLLNDYRGTTPFFLGGGINPDDSNMIRSLIHPQFYGVDLNSGFENYPGFKNFAALARFIDELQK
jgi:phosphoribosylanthranilate isomerase